MKISVALATYNGETFLQKQLDTLTAQTLKANEIIISDDVSQDTTANILNEFCKKNKNVKVFYNKENLGFKANFKNAVAQTTGDIVFLCDQDDIWYNEKLKTVCEFFKEHTDALAVASSFDFIDAQDSCIEENEQKCNHGLINMKIKQGEYAKISLKTVLHSNVSPGCTIAVKRSLADEFCQNSTSLLPHDWEFCLAAAAKGGLYFLNKALIGYRMHGNNTLGFNKKLQTREEIAFEKLNAVTEICKYEPLKEQKDFFEKRYNAIKNGKTLALIKLCFNKNYKRFFSFKEIVGDILYTNKK